MDEGRKRTNLVAASILARKLAQFDGKSSPALANVIAEAITLAERIMQKVDNRSAGTPPTQNMTSSAGYPWSSKQHSPRDQIIIPKLVGIYV